MEHEHTESTDGSRSTSFLLLLESIVTLNIQADHSLLSMGDQTTFYSHFIHVHGVSGSWKWKYPIDGKLNSSQILSKKKITFNSSFPSASVFSLPVCLITTDPLHHILCTYCCTFGGFPFQPQLPPLGPYFQVFHWGKLCNAAHTHTHTHTLITHLFTLK